jgi:hypothetical protein
MSFKIEIKKQINIFKKCLKFHQKKDFGVVDHSYFQVF